MGRGDLGSRSKGVNMFNYQELLQDVMIFGDDKQTRNGMTKQLFGYQWRHDMRQGYPLITTKRMSFKSVVGELRWMLSGSTSVTELKRLYNVTFWDEWGPDIGPGYGHQIRYFNASQRDKDLGFSHVNSDQLVTLMSNLKSDPHSRRHIVSHWNPLQEAKLPPCHVLWQVNVTGEFVDVGMYQRSADAFLGVPYNIGFYGLLLELISKEIGKVARHLVISFGDLHIYSNHFEQVNKQMGRTPKQLPYLQIKGDVDLCAGHWTAELHEYSHCGVLPAKVNV